MTRVIVTRSQHSVGSSGGRFGGPDMYLAVVDVPDGGASPKTRYLSAANAAKYGWRIRYIGEYYRQHIGPRSAFWALMQRAEAMGATWQYAEPAQRASFGLSAARVI